MLDPATQCLPPWFVAIALFMQTLDGTILNTTRPTMAKDLGESPLRMQPVVIAYMLIPASGLLADRFGTRRAFISAIVLFSLGSLLCAAGQRGHALAHTAVQFTTMNTLTLGDLDDARSSSGNSLLSLVMRLSMGLGVASASALLAAFAAKGAAPSGDDLVHTFHTTYICMGVPSALAAGIFFQLARHEGPSGPATTVSDA